MSEAESFEQWFGRLRAGDPGASADLVRAVEPMLRKLVRAHLSRLKLRHVVDPLDICQNTFGLFFRRVSGGRVAAGSMEQVRALLVTMARRRAQDEVRRLTADRRDHRRLVQIRPNDEFGHVESADPTPSKVVAGHELYREILRRLSPEERLLFEARSRGLDWASIAAAHGGDVRALRKKLNRAVQRVRHQFRLGQDETHRPAPPGPPAPH